MNTVDFKNLKDSLKDIVTESISYDAKASEEEIKKKKRNIIIAVSGLMVVFVLFFGIVGLFISFICLSGPVSAFLSAYGGPASLMPDSVLVVFCYCSGLFHAPFVVCKLPPPVDAPGREAS